MCSLVMKNEFLDGWEEGFGKGVRKPVKEMKN